MPQGDQQQQAQLDSPMKVLSPCKLCGQPALLVKSHIIPESFYEIPRQGDGTLKLLADNPGDFAKRVPTGIWSRIVCSKCEDSFARYDDYAARLLMGDTKASQRPTLPNGLRAEIYDDFNYDLLQLFFLSLVWRAAASDHVVFKGISLGPREEQIKAALRGSDPDLARDIAIVLYSTSIFAGTLSPHMERLDGGLRGVRIYLHRYTAIIKTDKRSFLPPSSEFHISRERPLCVVPRGLVGSGELPLMKAIVKANPSAF